MTYTRQDLGHGRTCTKIQNYSYVLMRYCLTIVEMFYRFRFSCCFWKRISKDRAVSSNSMVGKSFPVVSSVEIIDMSCWVIVDIRTFHEMFFESSCNFFGDFSSFFFSPGFDVAKTGDARIGFVGKLSLNPRLAWYQFAQDRWSISCKLKINQFWYSVATHVTNKWLQYNIVRTVNGDRSLHSILYPLVCIFLKMWPTWVNEADVIRRPNCILPLVYSSGMKNHFDTKSFWYHFPFQRYEKKKTKLIS